MIARGIAPAKRSPDKPKPHCGHSATFTEERRATGGVTVNTEQFIRDSAARGLSRRATMHALGIGPWKFRELLTLMPEITCRHADAQPTTSARTSKSSASPIAGYALRAHFAATFQSINGILPVPTCPASHSLVMSVSRRDSLFSRHCNVVRVILYDPQLGQPTKIASGTFPAVDSAPQMKQSIGPSLPGHSPVQ